MAEKKSEKKILNWDDVVIPEETVSEQDFKNAESSSNVPPGRYLCECVSTRPIERTDNEGQYNFVAVSLEWKVLKTLVLNDKPVPENEQDQLYENQRIFDEIRLEHRLEKDGMKKRRHFVAKRLGLLSDEKRTITKAEWATGPVGKRMILSVEDQEYTKKGETKTTTIHGKVKFNGYDVPEGAEPKAGDGFQDI